MEGYRNIENSGKSVATVKIIPHKSSYGLHGIVLLGLIWGGLAVSLTIAGFFYEHVPFMRTAWQCPTKVLTGRPCATCGTTRMYVHLGHGQILEALDTNPFMFILTVFGFLMGGYAVGTRMGLFPQVRVVLGRLEKRILAIGLVVLFLANWVYLILTGK